MWPPRKAGGGDQLGRRCLPEDAHQHGDGVELQKLGGDSGAAHDSLLEGHQNTSECEVRQLFRGCEQLQEQRAEDKVPIVARRRDVQHEIGRHEHAHHLHGPDAGGMGGSVHTGGGGQLHAEMRVGPAGGERVLGRERRRIFCQHCDWQRSVRQDPVIETLQDRG